MYKNNMKRGRGRPPNPEPLVRTNIFLTERQRQALDRLAEQQERTSSEIVREQIDKLLAAVKRRG
jgi:hypothetical protein